VAVQLRTAQDVESARITGCGDCCDSTGPRVTGRYLKDGEVGRRNLPQRKVELVEPLAEAEAIYAAG